MKIYRTLKNLLTYKWYSFALKSYSKSQSILKPGEKVRISGTVQNNGLRLGTVYVLVKLADPYDHKNMIFNSDRDFDNTTKQALRLIDITAFGSKDFCCDIPIPKDIKWGVLDIKIEVWTPAKLFNPDTKDIYFPFPFDEIEWRGYLEIIEPESMFTKVFVSYSWQSPQHQAWVRELTEELSRHKIETLLDQKDLHPGEEATVFMEEGTTQFPICLAICSEAYSKKADKRERGVGYEISILTNEILEGRKRFSIIPIIRDNPGRKRPKCFGSQVYIDMDNEQWRAAPLSRLVEAIKKATERLKKIPDE